MINNIFYIKNQEITSDIGVHNSFQHCANFCRQWNDGQQNFTINTSGSTGVPKRINISRKQMEISAKMTAQALSLQSGDHALICLNTSFISGKMMLVRGMVNGLNTYVTKPVSNPLREVPDDLVIDFMAVVPLQLEIMVADTQAVTRLDQMKAIIVGGAPVSFSLAEKIKSVRPPVYATYGMTETVSHIALKQLNGSQACDYYQVLDKVKIGQDERGCLTINSVLTNHQTIVTADMVNIINDQSFEWLGRADHVINSGGVKIHPELVEGLISRLLIHYGIQCPFFAFGIPDATLGEKVVLYLESVSISTDTIEQLQSFLKQQLPTYHAPKDIHCLEQFRYTQTGKIKRKETADNDKSHRT